MFAEDYIYESTAVTIDINGSIFTANGIIPKNPGWAKVEYLEEEDKKDEIITLTAFVEGGSVSFIPKTEEGKTKPPSRLTEASLGGKGGLMDKLLGLETSATRSSIIKTLIDREYIRVEKTKLFPTQKGCNGGVFFIRGLPKW